MNRLVKLLFITLLMLAMVYPVFARTSSDLNQTGRIYDQQLLNINELSMYISNFSIFGQNISTGNSGAYWPAGFPAETYIFGAGVWVGALIDTGFTITDGDTVRLYDTLVSCGYNANSGGTEFVPGDIDPNSPDRPSPWTNLWDIVYVSTNDNNSQVWPIRSSEGSDSVVSMQDSYCEYNDKELSAHETVENKPLEIEISQTTYAWVGPLKEDIIFMKFDIRNDRTDGNDLKQCFVGISADNDIGNESGDAANDLLGFIDTMTVDYNGVPDTLMQINVGYQFQVDDEAGWTHTPGIIAYKYMEAPIATDTVDVYHNGSYLVTPGNRIGMTTFNYFTIATDPVTKASRYQVMAGYDHTRFNPNDPEASFSPFPVWGVGVAGYPGQTQDPQLAADKRFTMASGPFTLKNDSVASVIIAIIMSKTPGEMLEKMLIAQKVYDDGWLGPVAPGQVNFDLVGLNKNVRIYWDNAQELIPDKYYTLVSDPTSPSYNPAYREYDIEGYNVYRSRTGAGGTWELLRKFDKLNEYMAVKYDSLIFLNNTTGLMETTYFYDTVGYNTGIPYFYEDTNLVNGITYYYTIRAYDVNYNDYETTTAGVPYGTSPLILEGAGKTKAVVPRSLTSNYTSGKGTINFVSGNADTANIKLKVFPVLDTMVEDIANDTFTLLFTGIDSSIYNPLYPSYMYQITNKAGTIVGQDKISLDTVWRGNLQYVGNVIQNYNAYSGFIFMVDTFTLDTTNWLQNGNSSIDAQMTSSDYTDSIVYTEYAATGRQFFHASKMYTLTWRDTIIAGDTNITLTVWDVDNDMEIPYSSRVIGDNWHFNYSTTAQAADYMRFMNSTSPALVRTGMYFSGLKISFNYTTRPSVMTWANRPKDGDVWTIVATPNDTTLTFKYPPVNSSYKFTITPSSFTEVEDSILDNIKVVPNPYVVRSELDLDYTYRRILFTNLPAVCTVKIYTLAGQLIRTLEHNTAYYVYSTVSSDSSLVYDNTNGYTEWDVLTENNQIPAPGIYIYHVQTPNGATKIGKFAVIK